MPKVRRTKRPASKPTSRAGSKQSTADSLREQVHDVAQQANVARRKSGNLARKSAAVQSAADKVHHGLEALHGRVEKTHTAIRGLRKRQPTAPGADGEPEVSTPGRGTEGRKRRPFLVAGVGASAGGFEAFAQLLERLPTDTPMALVFVQHLDPTHKSSLTTLLSRSTRIAVTEIRHRTPLAPNHVYVIPPNTALSVSGGVLQLSPRRKDDHYLPIDHFFQSLAHDQGNLAIGIVLSGNGHDGAAGLKEIKAAGGITFAQEIGSCKFLGMPESAIATGSVDYILSPAEIAVELKRIANHGGLKPAPPAEAPPGAENVLTRIITLLRMTTGVDFASYKPNTLKRRITRRMVLKRIETLGDYLRLLQKNRSEVELLFDDILINVTSFFRDPAAFQVLKKKILPRIISNKPAGTSIRIWVPGCATGEEVYSLAICLHELLGKNRNNKEIQIFGTDISETMVTKARSGFYPRSIETGVSPERLRRYFQKVDRGYQISKFIRDICIFARQNVVEDPPFSKLDLISCRNLLIYLGPALQKKILPTFHYSLRPGGYLLLGTSETIGPFANLFTLVDKKNKVYARTETYSRPDPRFELAHTPISSLETDYDKQAMPMREPDHFDLQKRAEQILLGQYCPPGVIVNARLEVLHFLGRTGPYLEPATGSASLNLMRMVRDELMLDLRTAIAQAARTRTTVRKEGIRFRFNGHFRDLTIDVVPFKNSLPEYLFLVLFRELPADVQEETGSGRKKSGPPRQHSERELQRLRAELQHTRNSLQTVIEEQEATNEELKSANEETQSANEELQSTNEELETAKEELQSTNEELTTLNEELLNRNNELIHINDDLNNLFGSFNMPILMLGGDLTIRRFTPLAQKFFNLIPSDVGRRISDINPNVALPDLRHLATEVVESLNVREIEVQDREGHWYSLRIRPYRTADNKIDGVVIVLVDIGEIRQGLEEVMEMVPRPMLLLSADLTVSKANEDFYKSFHVNAEETNGTLIFKLGNGQWNIPALRDLLEQVLPSNQHVEDFKVEHDFPHIGRRVFLVNARRLYQQSKGSHYVLVLLQDVTKQKSAAAAGFE